jgi:tetratricopeptide (TPR) repeat protein
MNDKLDTLCQRVDDAMAELIAGNVPDELTEHLADCDRCRDARHDAERAAEIVKDSAGDYVHPPDVEERLLRALDRGAGPRPTDTLAATPAERLAETLVDEPAAVSASDSEAEPVPARPGKTLAMDTADAEIARAGTIAAAQRTAPSETAPSNTAPSTTAPSTTAPSTTATAPGSDAPRSGAPPRSASLLQRLRRPRNTIAAGILGAVAVAAAVAIAVRPDAPQLEEATADKPWSGKVVSVSRAAGGEGGLAVCNAEGQACQAAAADTAIAAGAVLKTDDRTRAYLELGDGTRLALDRSTELLLSAKHNRTAKLVSGAIVADVAKVEGATARVDLPKARVDVLGTKFALRTMGDAASVDVTRGAVMLVDEKERAVKVRAGEEGRVYPGVAPYATSAPGLDKALSWSESVEDEGDVRGLGELRAKKPGNDKELDGAVKLTSHKVRVRIVDGFARTEVEEVFSNSTDQVLEGIYRFPMPPDAQIERLALETEDGKHLEEGAFVDRDRAAAIWRGAIKNAAPQQPQLREEIIWVPGPWRDPALLEWQRGGRFELRVFPIPRKGSRRIVLTYTQTIKPTSGVRRYVYPLAHDESGALTVGEFGLDVQVRGHDPSYGISSQGYALSRGAQVDGADTLGMTASQFVPTGDLVIEYATPDGSAEVSAWAYQPTAPATPADSGRSAKSAESGKPGEEATAEALAAVNDTRPYVALALRPKLPSWSDDAQRAYVLVVDASRSMYGERFKRSTALAARMVDELDRLDRFTVLACDTTCRAMVGGLRAPSREASAEVADFLSAITPDGASDPTAAVREAGAFASHAEGRALRVVYIGDGTPTAGPIRPNYVAQAVRDALPAAGATLTAVAIGADSDLDALGAMARGGGGVLLPYVPGQKVGEAAYAVLGASYGQSLRDVKVELPEGLTEVAPYQLDTIPAGGESFVVARMSRPRVAGTMTVRGRVGGKEFEQRFPLDLDAKTDAGNAFVPRLYAAARIADLEREGTSSARAKAVALSSAFSVASRYTSLLVLESPAMFKAFGLDNTRRVATWTGEEQARASESNAERKAGADEPEADEAKDKSADGDSEEWDDDSFFEEGEKGAGKAKKAERRSRDDFDAPSAAGAPATETSPPPAPAPQPAPPPPSNRPQQSAPAPKPSGRLAQDPLGDRRGRGMIPMRRIWERQALVFPQRLVPTLASADKIQLAESELAKDENRREALKQLFTLQMLAGNVERAGELAERWANKEALNPEALTARADVMARRGDRDAAIRMLGSVIDVRPDDIAAQRRLARLHRWGGRSALGCRHAIAIAQMRQNDAALLADAVHCGRQTGESRLVEDMLLTADSKVRARAETLISEKKDDAGSARGEVRLTATWSGGQDLDIALIHPDGQRISWLGAPTKEVISCEDAASTSREVLGVLGTKSGEYVIEIVRASGEGPVSGELTIHAVNSVRKVPFRLDGERAVIGTLAMSFQSRLVPVAGWGGL